MAKAIIRTALSLPRKGRRLLARARIDRLGAGAAAAAGDAARDRRAWQEAATHYRKALAANPGWTGIRVQLGNMLKECGELADAEQQYRMALAAEPDNADIQLQLGHALKLQARFADAREAYLSAACLDPELQAARVELRTAGMSDTVVERHVAAAAAKRAEETGVAPVAIIRDRRPLDHSTPRPVAGLIREVGQDFIAGELQDVSRDALPLTLVCRDDGRDIAVLVVEPSEGAFPRTIPFRMALEGRDAKGILRVTIEPAGNELSGSPLLLPDVNGSALLDRISRIEERLMRSSPPEDLAAQIEQRLAPRITQIAADRLERIIRHQRENFELQLNAIEARLGQTATAGGSGLGAGEQLPAPPSLILAAQEDFPGLGWSAVTMGAGGLPVRRIAGRAHLAVRLSTGCGVVLQARIPATTSRAQVGRLMAGAAGNWVPFWIDFREETGMSTGHWLLSALIPPGAIEPGGTVSCFLDCAPGVGGDGDGLPVSAVALHSVPICAMEDISYTGNGWWTVQAGSDGVTTLILPGIVEAADAKLELSMARGPTDPLLALNGHSLDVRAGGEDISLARIPASAWNLRHPNVLRVGAETPQSRMCALSVRRELNMVDGD